MTMRKAQALYPAAVAGHDLGTIAGCTAARLRLATDLARCLTPGTLLRYCRTAGMEHVLQSHQAAYALAAAAIPAPNGGMH